MTASRSQADVPELVPGELKQRLDRGDRLQLIDVREPFEWEIANLERHGARLIPLGDLPERMTELDPQGEIVVYCRTGSRSKGAVRYLLAHGFVRVHNLSGGINAWAEEVDPELPTY